MGARILLVLSGFAVGAWVTGKHLGGQFPPGMLLIAQVLNGALLGGGAYAAFRRGESSPQVAPAPPDSLARVVRLKLEASDWKLQEYSRDFTSAERAELTALRDRQAFATLFMAWLYPLSALIPLAIQEKPWSWLVSGILLLMTLLVRHRVLPTLRSTLLSLRADLAAGGVDGSAVEGQSCQERLRASQLHWTDADWRRKPHGYAESLMFSRLMKMTEPFEHRFCNLLMTLAVDEGELTVALGPGVEVTSQKGTVVGKGASDLVQPLRLRLMELPDSQVLRIDGQPYQVQVNSGDPDRFQIRVEKLSAA